MVDTKENKITMGWLIYFIVCILIVFTSSIMQKSSILLLISSVFGVMYTLLNAKEKRFSFIFRKY